MKKSSGKKRGSYKKVPVDLEEVTIDACQSKKARLRAYLRQVKDPYHVRIGGVQVTMEYAEDGGTMQQAVDTLTSIDL